MNKFNGLKSLLASIAIVSVMFVSGCVSGKYPEPPAETDESADARSDGYEYTIGPGDMLNIFVWGYEDLSDTVPVRPDGQITTRLVEDMQASGKTPTQLARELEQQYLTYVKKPVVTVSVNQFVGVRSQQIKIIGAGEEPRTVPYTNRMTLLDLVIEVGGIAEFASGNRAILIRETADERETYSLRIDDLIRKGDISANVPLSPGDIVIVPESWF